ncbi:MAG TPA: metallophosphoesterase [Holophagaceae bacterium]|nr:metallophosphoesterase [Holophagaceae bacterium]
MRRRELLAALGALPGMASAFPLRASETASSRVTVLHTNDTHSRIEPFPEGGGAYGGLGGLARRATLVKRLRKELGGALLVDAGDAFQGTPWFNLYKGRVEFKLMDLVGYDAVTLGNHDFDGGVRGLVDAMGDASFPFVNCNFDCAGAPELARRIRPFVVKELHGRRIGITGVGIGFKGLVPKDLHAGVEWIHPYEALPPVVERLRTQERCDLVLLCSHLGLDEPDLDVDDRRLASKVPGIHAILSGHLHTLMEQPARVKNDLGETVIFRVGMGGAYLGRLEFSFAPDGRVAAASASRQEVG